MKNKKQAIILSVIASIVLLVLIVGATYAYFQASGGTGTSANLRVTTYTTDVFNFEVGNDISIYADATSFASGKGNASGSTFAKAILSANNKTNSATKYYYLYLNISKNTFTYTQNEDTPEILLTIKDDAGNEITSINDLTYKTVTDGKGATIKGFDITTGIGLITLLNNKEITASPQKTDTWNVTVTFINYDKDQSKNAGKSFNAKLIAQQKEISDSVSDYCKNGDNLANCIISLGAPDVFGATKVYHHDENLVNGANDNSYRYAGGDNTCIFNGENVQGAYSNATFGASNENDCKKVYSITSTDVNLLVDASVTRLLSDEKPVTWSEGACKTTDGESVNVGFASGNFNPVTEATCKGKSYIVKTDDLTARVANLNMEYAGAGKWNRVNNFVCFGSTETPCPTDNLYRIIGIFEDKVKLIKYDYANSNLLGTDGDYKGSSAPNSSYYKGSLTSINTYYWNYKNNTSINNGSNIWSTSLLNKINLNTNFLNNIGTTWSNLIEDATWKVSGHSTRSVTPSEMYTAEITNATKTYGPSDGTSKIGLVYASDYGFAASPSAWTKTLNNYSGNDANGTSIITINWMYMGYYDWTLTPNSSDSHRGFYLFNNGNLYYGSANNGYGSRPVMYLKSSVLYARGSGTKNSPITLVV